MDKSVIKRGLVGVLILVAVGILLAFSTLISGERAEQQEPVLIEESDNSLKVILQIEKETFQLRESIPVHLVITNEELDEPLKLGFASSQRYDFIISREGEEIWRWSQDKVFAMMLEEAWLEPGESLNYTETWEQQDNQGEFVLPGKYEVVGVLKTFADVASEPAIVEIIR